MKRSAVVGAMVFALFVMASPAAAAPSKFSASGGPTDELDEHFFVARRGVFEFTVSQTPAGRCGTLWTLYHHGDSVANFTVDADATTNTVHTSVVLRRGRQHLTMRFGGFSSAPCASWSVVVLRS